MKALNIDPQAYAAGVRMAQFAVKAFVKEFPDRLRALVGRAVDPVFGSMRTQFKVLGVYAREAFQRASAGIEGWLQRFPVLHAAVVQARAGFRLLGDSVLRVRDNLVKAAVLFGAAGQGLVKLGKWGGEAFRKVRDGIKTVYDKSGPLKWTIETATKGFKKLGTAALGVLKAALPWVANIAGGLGLAATAAQYLSARLVAFGRGIASLGPLVAFLPALVGSFLLLRRTLAAVSTGIREQLKPVSKAFKDASKDAADLAGKGIAPIGREFLKVNFPVIRSAMDQIAISANGAARNFGKWLNSAPGMRLVQGISKGTADAFKILAPKVEKAAEALGRLANRAQLAHRIRETGEAVGRLADRFRRWANSKSTKDVENALRTLGDAFGFIRDKVKMVKDVIVWMADNGDKVRKFSDALAAVGIAVGLFTGPIGVILGSLTLLANHWDTVKKSFSDTGGIGRAWDQFKKSEKVQAFVDAAKDAWDRFSAGFQSTVPMIREQLDKILPALSDSLGKWAPIIQNSGGLFEALGKTVGVVIAGIVTVTVASAKAWGVFADAVKTMVTIVGGLMKHFLTGIIAPTLDALGTAIGVFDKDLGAKMHNAAEATRQGARNIQAYIDGINGRDIYVNVVIRRPNGTVDNRATKNARAVNDARNNAVGTTYSTGGPTIVGEYGPELVEMPRGAAVHTAGETQLMAAHGTARKSGGHALGQSILTGVLSGMKSQAPAVFKYLRAFANQIASMKVSAATKTRIQNIVTDYLPKFAALKDIEGAIDRQKQKIQSLIAARKQFAESVAQSNYGGAASLIGAIPAVGSGGTGNLGSDFAAVMQDRATKLKEFARNLEALRGRGLSKTVLSQFAESGVEQSGDLVQSLMGAGDGVLGTINQSASSLAAGSKSLGSRWASQMYDAGIQAAQGRPEGSAVAA